MQAQTQILPSYQELIARLTGAPRHLLPILEEIMRTEVFYSTLDWQSKEELQDGARRAFAYLKKHRAYYEADFRHREASVRLETAERALETLRRTPVTTRTLATSLAEL